MRGFYLIVLSLLCVPGLAKAGHVEMSAQGTAYRFANTDDSLTEGIGFQGNISIYFMVTTALELSYENTFQLSRTSVGDTNTRVQVGSASILQSFFPKSRVQPFLKLGGGYLHRKITTGGTTFLLDSFSGTAGLGLRFFFSRRFGLRLGATVYVTRDTSDAYIFHYSLMGGISVRFGG